MSNPFQNFMSGTPESNGVKRTYKSYAHASGLYQEGNRMTKLPKLGFIYFVEFIFDNSVNWLIPADQLADLGFLAKKVDLPKFKITTQTVNQYNRKANVQTKLTYDPITIDFHDDNSEITTRLWQSYVQHYYADSRYNDAEGKFTQEFYGDTKYKAGTTYGYAPRPSQNKPFFYQINIYVLHQGNFSQYSISNPIVTQWDHDTVQQDQGTKVLQNKITFAYDNVAYHAGTISAKDVVNGIFEASWYDKDTNIKQGYAPPASVKPAVPAPTYPTPQSALSSSQLDKISTQLPVIRPPRPIGAGTWGLTSYRPPSFGLGSVDVWYGYGGLHTRAIVNAGPIRLVLKR